MEIPFCTDDDCGSDSHSAGRGRGRGGGRVGGRSHGSGLSGGSNPGGAASGGRSTGGHSVGGRSGGGRSAGGGSAGGGRSTPSGRGVGEGDMPPPTEGSSGRPKRNHEEVSGAGESGSTASGSTAKRARKITPKEDRLSEAAIFRIRQEVLDFFNKHDRGYLERSYLSSGKEGLEAVKKVFMNMFLLALGTDEEYLRDRRLLHYQDRLQDLVQESVFNPINCYTAIYRNLPIDLPKTDLLLKIEWFKAKAVELKGKGRHTLPKFIQNDLATKIATQNRQGVLWLPRHARVVAKDGNRFEGGYGIVRQVEIKDVETIPPFIQFAGKTMKGLDNLEHRKSRSTEALACPIDHPGVIKVMYLDRRTYESFTLWWNGGSLFGMQQYDKRYAPEMHETELLRSPGPDYEARKRLVLYRKKRAHLAWALMNIMAAVSVQDVLHNDLSPNNVLLHFPDNDDDAIYIGVCDWGLATWTGEVAPSLYGKPNDTELTEAKRKYNWVAPELFHLTGATGSATSPRRASRAHVCTALTDSFTTGLLAKKIYMHDTTSELFQKNRDPKSTVLRFEHALNQLLQINPQKRSTIVHVVNTLKGGPYYLEEPTMCYRQSI